MAARAWVVRWFGESVARRIEQFVDGTVFGDELVVCPGCSTPVAATFLSERGKCPICGTTATKEVMIEVMEAKRRAVLARGEAAISQVEEIDRQLVAMRQKV